MAGLLPRVGLILTGGTIDSVGTDRLDLAWYIEANRRLGDGALLAQLPELKSIARVQEIPFRRLPSQALLDSDWLDLVRKIHSIFEQTESSSHMEQIRSKRQLISSTLCSRSKSRWYSWGRCDHHRRSVPTAISMWSTRFASPPTRNPSVAGAWS